MEPSDNEIVGVILAAGKGSRMTGLPTSLPKPVLPILNKPIICHQLDAMRSLGIGKAFIVVGARGSEIAREIERFGVEPGLDIEYVHQDEPLGIAHCVGCLESMLDGPFFLFLGDIYFHAPRIQGFLDEFRKPGVDAVIGAVEEDDPAVVSKNFCISVDDAGRVTQVIEKPRFPKSRIKGVGLYVFSPVVFDAIRHTPRTTLRDEYELTDSIQIMIDYGYTVRLSFAVERDLNVTYPADLLDANLWLLKQNGLVNFIAPGTQVSKGAELENAVVGSCVRIGADASLKDCVVFAGCEIPAGERIANAIVTEEAVLRL